MAYSIVFPGQGSQSVGMLGEYGSHPIFQKHFEKASELLGYDLWQLTQVGPAETLNQTYYTQSALFVASFSAFRMLQPQLPPVSYMAGHSLGELTALAASGAIDFETGVKLVQNRAKWMQSSVPEGVGAMAAIIGLDDLTVAKVCEQASGENLHVSPANFNSKGQVVIAGHKQAVLDAMELAKAHKARMCKQLPVSVPSHCQLMAHAKEAFSAYLADCQIQMPNVPVISNVLAKPYSSCDEIRTLLAAQLCKPVKWVDTIEYMVNNGTTHMIECGPGSVLSGLIKRINREVQCVDISKTATLVE